MINFSAVYIKTKFYGAKNYSFFIRCNFHFLKFEILKNILKNLEKYSEKNLNFDFQQNNAIAFYKNAYKQKKNKTKHSWQISRY